MAPPAKNTRGWLSEPLGINVAQWSHQFAQRKSAIGWLQWLHRKHSIRAPTRSRLRRVDGPSKRFPFRPLRAFPYPFEKRVETSWSIPCSLLSPALIQVFLKIQSIKPSRFAHIDALLTFSHPPRGIMHPSKTGRRTGTGQTDPSLFSKYFVLEMAVFTTAVPFYGRFGTPVGTEGANEKFPLWALFDPCDRIAHSGLNSQSIDLKPS